MTTKKAYQAPKLKTHGSLESLTHGASDGSVTDAAFSNDTPRGELTFS